MKFIKSNFFLFCFFFFCLSVKGDISKSNTRISTTNNFCSVVSSTAPVNESAEFTEMEGVLSSCLRLSERSVVSFQTYENTLFFSLSPVHSKALFSKACYSWYRKRQFKQFKSCPLYICHHRLLI